MEDTRLVSMKRVKVIAVNILARIPMVSVMAKPRTEPLPNPIKITAASNVVILESKIVANAFLKPDSMATRSVLPARSSSFNRSKIITLASTAIPTDSRNAAITGRVIVALMATFTPITMMAYISSAKAAIKPGIR